jgi:tRNA (mo5U34)-methyltransferase
MTAAETQSLGERIAQREWYHTIELAPGVETRGYFDLREVALQVLPVSLKGARCLDVATFDGFWALEMLKRGAEEVVGIDILDPRRWDWPAGSDDRVLAAVGERKGAGEGFEIVMDALGHHVDRHEQSVYELDPADIGRFDFVYVGSLLLHLREPVRAIEAVRSVCRDRALFVDAIDPVLTRLHPRRPVASFDGLGRPWWWKPNLKAIERMVRSGGFEIIGRPQRVKMMPGEGFPPIKPGISVLRSQQSRAELRIGLRGDPHVAINARPHIP